MMQSHQFLLPNSFIVDPISPNNRLSGRISYTFVHLDGFQFQFQFQFPYRKSIITCARNGSSKGLFGSQRSRKTLVKLALFAASNLHYVLPAPLNSVIREFGGGDGGGGGGRSGGGSWKGFGWGGFDGRKRRVNKKLGFWIWGFTAVCCLGFWALILGGKLELGKDVLSGALCLSMFLVLLRNGCVPEWLLGFCSGASVVGLSIHKRDELQRLIKGFKAIGMARRRQKGRRTI